MYSEKDLCMIPFVAVPGEEVSGEGASTLLFAGVVEIWILRLCKANIEWNPSLHSRQSFLCETVHLKAGRIMVEARPRRLSLFEKVLKQTY